MAPVPPFLVRMLTTLIAPALTQALTRRLASSPVFFSLVDRIIHEVDHIPHRINGKPIPKYSNPLDPQDRSLTDQAREAWQRQSNADADPSEPHDIPNPYPSKNVPKATNEAFERAQEERSKRARETMQAARKNADRDRQRQRKQEEDFKANDYSRQLRELQEKLRQSKNKE